MEYIKYIKKDDRTITSSSDNMDNLFEFIETSLCHIEPWKTEAIEAMRNGTEYWMNSQVGGVADAIGPNRVLLYNVEFDNDAKIELPFDALCDLKEKYFEISRDLRKGKIEIMLITFENDVFEMSLEYCDGRKEHYRFEPNSLLPQA